METVISTIVTFGYISAIIVVVFLILLIIKKSTFYPSSRQEEVSDKIFKINSIAGIAMIISFICFMLSKELIKQDFNNTLSENKIISFEVDNFFINPDEIRDAFKNFESSEGRFRCEKCKGFINFKNGKNIPIEVFRHCYEDKRYTIISKKYSIDATIGDVRTSAFDFIKNDSITSQ
ncbi:hypothetical protein [Epilithonimonas zeae]|uniref:hypothetical protein n=1 Tax=Epilithonimonas zeae TaxID=1416779 RepID=UPI00200CE2A6|nr:hypothetical protein [Epilithonimonas zeae]UQB68289.1 hypothetical protein KI430_14880 [Epilithonimonas zeae]